MAGMILVGVPLIGGIVGGSCLQLVLRTSGVGIKSRGAAELACILYGGVNIYQRPPGGANTCNNWDVFMVNGALVVSGVVAMAEGIFLNVTGNSDVVLSCAGALGLYGGYRLMKHYLFAGPGGSGTAPTSHPTADAK